MLLHSQCLTKRSGRPTCRLTTASTSRSPCFQRFHQSHRRESGLSTPPTTWPQLRAWLRNTGSVAAFEDAFAQFVGAKFAVSCVNGTATLHSALVALGVEPGDPVSVPCITMAATTAAVLH